MRRFNLVEVQQRKIVNMYINRKNDNRYIFYVSANLLQTDTKKTNRKKLMN